MVIYLVQNWSIKIANQCVRTLYGPYAWTGHWGLFLKFYKVYSFTVTNRIYKYAG